jgi:hypothetical protein
VRLSLLSATLALIVAAGSLAPASAQQQDELRRRGDIACKTSSNKLCSKFFGQGDMAMLSCFQQNATRLSQSCRSFLIEVGQLQR